MVSASHASPPVEARFLSKNFGRGKGEVHALTDVSLTVEKGEYLSIIGPSGSGKSTLLHLIAGLTTPNAGELIVGSHNITRMRDRELTMFRREHIGFIFQAYNLIPILTVEDNLRLPLMLQSGKKAEQEKVEFLLETLGLQDRRMHRPDQLSGGEQQRVAIGRAIIADPTVILADEPTGNLDSVNGRRLCELMHRLCSEHGRTIITVTHDPAVAFWAKRVMVLKDGHIVETIGTSSLSSAGQLGARFHEILEAKKEPATCA